MKGGMAILRPLLAETGAESIGTVVIGTVKGDIHDIGKNPLEALNQKPLCQILGSKPLHLYPSYYGRQTLSVFMFQARQRRRA